MFEIADLTTVWTWRTVLVLRYHLLRHVDPDLLLCTRDWAQNFGRNFARVTEQYKENGISLGGISSGRKIHCQVLSAGNEKSPQYYRKYSSRKVASVQLFLTARRQANWLNTHLAALQLRCGNCYIVLAR